MLFPTVAEQALWKSLVLEISSFEVWSLVWVAGWLVRPERVNLNPSPEKRRFFNLFSLLVEFGLLILVERTSLTLSRRTGHPVAHTSDQTSNEDISITKISQELIQLPLERA